MINKKIKPKTTMWKLFSVFISFSLVELVTRSSAFTATKPWAAPKTTTTTTTRTTSETPFFRLYSTSGSATNNRNGSEVIGSLTILLPSQGAEATPSKFGRHSAVPNPSLLDAARHLTRKANWFANEKLVTDIVTIPTTTGKTDAALKINNQLCNVDVLIAMGHTSESDLAFVEQIFKERRERSPQEKFRQCQFALDCDKKSFPCTVGPFDKTQPSIQSTLLPWTNDASGRRFVEQMNGLFDRWTSDDFCIAIMVFLNQFSGSPVDWVRYSADATWEKGPVQNAQEFYAMATKCGDCIAKCLQDESCKTCLETLTALDTRDQVASYRTIVSYESEYLKDMSFCIFQKHNIFNCKSKIPTTPKVTPIAQWRGQPLTVEAGRSLLVGHLDDEAAPEGSLKTDISWKVTLGANVAFDQFPSQNQLFYETINGRDLWYDPVFRVETLDGRHVWCKRHYKVRNGPNAGTFRLSVLDNGVTSNEFWTIIGAADDLSWIAFHYAGAAAAVGQSYLGGLLCTPDGSLPPESELSAIWETFRSAGIEPWELYVVDNDQTTDGYLAAGPPPLDFYRKEVLATKAARKTTASTSE